ncbi:hypothetical protein GCM10009557_67890 [Virgisporangium ochraceum]
MFLTLLAAAFALLATESVAVAVVAAVALWASVWVNIVLHEFGHLGAALLMRVPVVAVRIMPFTGWRNEVLVRPSPSASALRARMVVVYLGGALANLATAVGVASVVNRFPLVIQLVLVEAFLVAVLLGVLNLMSGATHDGTLLWLWLAMPAEVREWLREARFREEVNRTLRLIDPGDVEPLTAYLDRHLGTATEVRADLVADAERLSDLPGADPAIAQVLTIQFGMWYLHAAAVIRAPVEHKELDEIVAVARRAFDARPDSAASRIAMGLAELLAERPERAGEVLARVRPADGDVYDVAVLLRAAAGHPFEGEAGGRFPELARVVRAVRHAGPGLAMSQRTPRRQGPVIAAVNPLPSEASP